MSEITCRVRVDERMIVCVARLTDRRVIVCYEPKTDSWAVVFKRIAPKPMEATYWCKTDKNERVALTGVSLTGDSMLALAKCYCTVCELKNKGVRVET